jgi:hypothetical protein
LQKIGELLGGTHAERMARADAQMYTPVVVHGTGRLDRLLEKPWLDPKRATSGPMPFFTDATEVGSNYAKNKPDTSLAYENGEFSNWFKIKAGRGKEKNLDTVWWNLPESEKQQLSANLGKITLDDDGALVFGDGPGGKAHWDWALKEARGNPIQAAKDIWLNSGLIFDEEEKFIDVLKAAGLKSPVRYNSPNISQPGMLAARLRITNPLDTSNREAMQGVLSALEQASKGKRYKQYTSGADQWDKNNIGIREFTDRLRDDLGNGTTHAWTSIPDVVTTELKKLGYDGIFDAGGKGGGMGHNVYIPFEANQVRSVNAMFDPAKQDSSDLLASLSNVAAPLLKGAIGTGAVYTAAGALAPEEAEASFIGTLAKTFPHDMLGMARKMKDYGLSRAEIWRKTGIDLDNVDGLVRSELDDSGMKVKMARGVREGDEIPRGSVNDVLTHDGLIAAYPDIAEVRATQIGNKNQGSFDPVYRFGNQRIKYSSPNVAAHELQHGIQDREGFAIGGLPENFESQPIIVPNELKQILGKYGFGDFVEKDPEEAVRRAWGYLNDSGASPEELAKVSELTTQAWNSRLSDYDQYKMLAGEAEARNVQTRLNMTAVERRATPPWETLDVPESEQIVRMKGSATPAALAATAVGTGAGMAAYGAGTDAPEYEQRLHQIPFPRIDNGDGSVSTHEMAVEVDDNGNWFAFPTIQPGENGQLQRFELREAQRRAMETGNYKAFGQDKDAALRYGEGGYKTGTNIEPPVNMRQYMQDEMEAQTAADTFLQMRGNKAGFWEARRQDLLDMVDSIGGFAQQAPAMAGNPLIGSAVSAVRSVTDPYVTAGMDMSLRGLLAGSGVMGDVVRGRDMQTIGQNAQAMMNQDSFETTLNMGGLVTDALSTPEAAKYLSPYVAAIPGTVLHTGLQVGTM